MLGFHRLKALLFYLGRPCPHRLQNSFFDLNKIPATGRARFQPLLETPVTNGDSGPYRYASPTGMFQIQFVFLKNEIFSKI